MASHENSGTARIGGAFPSQPGDLAMFVNLVEFEDGQLNLMREWC